MKSFIGLITFFYSMSCFALFCPGANFNQIQLGDTMELIQKQCGAPSLVKSTKIDNQPQEWTYYVKVLPNAQGTLKMTIAFVDRKVVNMSVNSSGVTYTAICGPAIQLGNTPEQIKAACGDPAFIASPNPNTAAGNIPPTEITEFDYFGPPKVTLIFENGKLKERK